MNRESELKLWLNDVLQHTNYRILPLAGDASFRRYYRLITGSASYVVMDAPPPEEPGRFVHIAQLLSKNGLSVPEIRHQNLKQGFLVLSDFGNDLYLDALTDRTVDVLYDDAMKALVRMQTCSVDSLPIFDRGLLNKQMKLFSEWYVEKHLKIAFTANMEKIVAPMYEILFDTFSMQPQVFVHRDYHSRNLMIIAKDSPGILDFQDAVMGPITYDLVSLFQDCYISWPRKKIEQWIANYHQLLLERKMITKKVDLSEFVRWFDLTGLQRHLKNLGIFARLNYRDGKANYLEDMPTVFNNILDTCERYAFLNPLRIFLMDIAKRDNLMLETICVR
jgi:aminoglycoside/choline kinase family phosphotransferase